MDTFPINSNFFTVNLTFNDSATDWTLSPGTSMLVAPIEFSLNLDDNPEMASIPGQKPHIISGVTHSVLCGLGLTCNLLVLMLNAFQCNSCNMNGQASTVSISFLSLCDILYSLLSGYYAAGSFLGVHDFLGPVSCWLNGADVALMHINIWGTFSIGLQRLAAIENPIEYRTMFTLKFTLLIQLAIWSTSLVWGTYLGYNFEYQKADQFCAFTRSGTEFTVFIVVIYVLSYVLPTCLIVWHYFRFGKYFRAQIHSTRRRATFNCPRTGYQRYMDARNQFLHFYAYAVAISVFACYTPFFNYRLAMILNYHLFGGNAGGGFFSRHQDILPIIEGVSIVLCEANSVINPFLYILLKLKLQPNMIFSYQIPPMRSPNEDSKCIGMVAINDKQPIAGATARASIQANSGPRDIVGTVELTRGCFTGDLTSRAATVAGPDTVAVAAIHQDPRNLIENTLVRAKKGCSKSASGSCSAWNTAQVITNGATSKRQKHNPAQQSDGAAFFTAVKDGRLYRSENMDLRYISDSCI